MFSTIESIKAPETAISDRDIYIFFFAMSRRSQISSPACIAARVRFLLTAGDPSPDVGVEALRLEFCELGWDGFDEPTFIPWFYYSRDYLSTKK